MVNKEDSKKLTYLLILRSNLSCLLNKIQKLVRNNDANISYSLLFIDM